MLPEFTPTEHASEVYDELVEAVHKLKGNTRKQILKRIAKTLQTMTSQNTTAVQRVGEDSTSEGEEPVQRVVAPDITTTNNPTSEKALRTNPRTHQ